MDAVFVGNDQMALSVLREALRRGIRVPEQLSVVGFDNIAEFGLLLPLFNNSLSRPPVTG